MADTAFSALTGRNYTAVNYSFVFVDGSGVPYRWTGPMPVMDVDGNFAISGNYAGGFGARATSGSTDWNNAANTVPGSTKTLMQPTATNGPGGDGYFHPFNFEFTTRDGSGNVTQIAVPYSLNPGELHIRGRFGGTWSTWRQFLVQGSSADFSPATDNTKSLGLGSKRFSVVYSGTGSINTSDEREKRDIGAIPDDWLDAWGDVEWCRFRFKEGSRWHVGLVAQRVHAAFAARGLDAFEIGLCCFDAWGEVREPVIGANGQATKRTRVAQPAGDRWGLRYDECFAIEAAWQRRELVRVRAALELQNG